MKTRKYVCTLLSDVILTQNPGSKTPNGTLDFIPGNVFLGIVAGSLYKETGSESMELFHSGRVRFGDAHPLTQEIRSLRVPSMLYYAKGTSLPKDGAYVMYKWSDKAGAQPKQCRRGFYAFSGIKALFTDTGRTSSIKSAYDRERRKSMDEKMYSYESLRKGLKFAFEIEFDDEGLEESVTKTICGYRHIGHSKTAQYGLVNIESADFILPSSNPSHDSFATVYADGRLVFLDKMTGFPTFQPTAQDLGFDLEAKIDWSLSQVRTFQYAPWNGKRGVPDSDRCGIEKGSVFVVSLNGTSSPSVSGYVGCFNAEGFGKVIYNPDFLNCGLNGKSVLTFSEDDSLIERLVNGDNVSGKNSSLLDYLSRMDGNYELDDYSVVNDFIASKDAKIFINSEESFSSQWGYIRTLAETSSSFSSFREELEKYLDKGVASQKWMYRKNTLLNFIDKEELKIKERNWKGIVVNLAAEMAKKCKR